MPHAPCCAVVCLPLAAGLDWLEALLPILFVLFWIVSQIVNVVRGVAGRARRPEPPPPPRRGPPAGQAAQIEAELQRQIEAFRRHQAEQMKAARSGVAAKPARELKPQPPRPSRAQPRRPESAPAAAGGDRHLGRLDKGGTDVARHVQDVFGQEMAHLPTPLEAAPAAPSAATAGGTPSRVATANELVAALRNPVTLRQLILVRELLERPVGRW